MGEDRGGASKLRKAARKMVLACASFSRRQALVDPVAVDDSTTDTGADGGNISEIAREAESSSSLANKNLCTICLDPLSYGTSCSPGQAIFTAQCAHAFHFGCISSNVRHGSVTCPVCRAHWTQLPRNLNSNQADPVLRILDDSIATFRVHRRSFLRSARYADDDPIEPDHTPNHSRLLFSLIPPLPNHHGFHPSLQRSSCHPPGNPSLHQITNSSYLPLPENLTASGQGQLPFVDGAYLSVRMAHEQPTDLVLVASPNGPHLRLLKQSMALAVFSLRSVDRLAIVAYSSAAARVFPLRRMTSYGKRTALQVIDRLFYMGQADPVEGLKKGLKILQDRTHKNPRSCILHLSDSPTRSYRAMDMPIPIHQFHVGLGLGTSNGFVMQEFEEFLERMLGGVIRETRVWIGEEARILRLGELRGGEERRIPMDLGECGRLHVGYSYVDECCIKTGETLVVMEDERERNDNTERDAAIVGGRTSSVESWDYHDPYMARRWAKHLHGYRL